MKTETFSGPISKVVTIKSDSTENPQTAVFCKAVVKPIFEISPTSRLSKHVKLHQKYEDQVTIREKDGQPFAVDKVENTSDLFKTTLFPPAKPGEAYVVKIESSSPLPIGRTIDRVRLHTDNAKKPIVDIFTHVFVDGPVGTNPDYLQFFKGEAGDSATVSIYPNDKNKRIKIGKITAPDGVKAEIAEKTDGKNYLVRATLTRAMEYAPGLKLSIETDQRDQPVVEIPILIVGKSTPSVVPHTVVPESTPQK